MESPQTPNANDRRVVAQLKQIDDIEENLWNHAGLRHADREREGYAAVLMPALYRAGLSEPLIEIPRWHIAFGRTLMRMMVQLAYFHAHNTWSRVRASSNPLVYADVRARDHCAYALFALYTAWNQLAHHLNIVLRWGAGDHVYPWTIRDKAGADAFGGDPWLKELVQRLASLGGLFKMRNLETHELGLLDDILKLIALEGTARPDADKKFNALRDEYHFLLDARPGIAEFLDRNAAEIVRRHAP